MRQGFGTANHATRGMGNSAGTGKPAPHSPPSRLRLRRGKKIAGCPCFLSEQALTWEALTGHDKFRHYVLRHLLDEGFICSVLENGEREQTLVACEGVLYYKVSLGSSIAAGSVSADCFPLVFLRTLQKRHCIYRGPVYSTDSTVQLRDKVQFTISTSSSLPYSVPACSADALKLYRICASMQHRVHHAVIFHHKVSARPASKSGTCVSSRLCARNGIYVQLLRLTITTGSLHTHLLPILSLDHLQRAVPFEMICLCPPVFGRGPSKSFARQGGGVEECGRGWSGHVRGAERRVSLWRTATCPAPTCVRLSTDHAASVSSTARARRSGS